jgi:predicted porin
LTGNLDFAYGTAKAGSADAQKTISTRDMAASTSVINITATEDMGAGTKATVQYGIDPRKFARDQTTEGATPTAEKKGLLFSDETYVGLAGNAGNVRLGSPNSIGLGAFGAGSVMGTGIGSGYANQHLGFTSNIRYAKSARYDSPAFSGVTLSYLKAQGADAAVSQVSGSTAAANEVVAAGKSVTELGAAYANGPLNINFAQVTNEAYGAEKKRAANTLGANYALGATTLYVGMTSGKLLTDTTAVKTQTGSTVGVKYTMGQIDLMASMGQRKDTGTDAQKTTGARAVYNFSKTTATYIGYDAFTAPAAANDFKMVSVGLKKSF